MPSFVKKKSINDPIYGFISVTNPLILEIIEHGTFQRLRRIKQLGLIDFVYPGALHTRFHHALGALTLMEKALKILIEKGAEISKEEYEASQIAIMLHDIGHGPFSHALEGTLLPYTTHEKLSLGFMKKLNRHFHGNLELAIKIFENTYTKKFFHQLVNSQLDIDRLDYLTRDCFFTGVNEGNIGAGRIISMLKVSNNQLLVEEKGIYSVEHFLHARRSMYWQVYLHKTAMAAEQMLVSIIKRARYLIQSGETLQCSESLKWILIAKYTDKNFNQKYILDNFGMLDDTDVWGAIKLWQNHGDRVLSILCKMLLERNLFQTFLSKDAIKKRKMEDVLDTISKSYHLPEEEAQYLLSYGTLSNKAYVSKEQGIHVLTQKGKIKEIAYASDLPNIKALNKVVTKNYFCWPKQISLNKEWYLKN